jgi:putative peptide zinc metalloprotease protein
MALFSSHWYRVAALRPRIAPHVRIERQRQRGDLWYLWSDEVGGRICRLNPAAYGLAARFDGQLDVQALWDARQRDDADAVTQDEFVELLVKLRERALIDFDQPADFAALLPHLERVSRPTRRFNPLMWRITLGNPTRLLDRIAPLGPYLFSRATLWLWLIGTGLLLMVAVMQWPALQAHAERWLSTPRYLLLALCLYPPIKLMHELSHGLAVRRWGGQVHEAGVTLMLLMPMPYVDASAASAFRDRRQRMAVSAAGIMAELFVAAIAMIGWLTLADGVPRDAAFVALFIAGLSTLLFNANPLQRFDGYYLLTDALQLPNLGPRSRTFWGGLVRRRFGAAPDADPMVLARGERPWLIAYAPLSLGWQVGIGISIAVWLGSMSSTLGAVAVAVLAWQWLLKPAGGAIAHWRRLSRAGDPSAPSWRVAAVALGLLVLVAVALPLPQHTLAQGVVWPPDHAQLRAESEGFVQAIHRSDGSAVQAGDLLLELRNPRLEAEFAQEEARVAALESELFQALHDDSARAQNLNEELDRARHARARIEERLRGLQVRAGATGQLVLPHADDLHDSFAKKGALLGYVLTAEATTVRVAIPDAQVALISEPTWSAQAWLADWQGGAIDGVLVRDGSGAAPQLPSAALSTRHGGHIVTDPKDPHDMKTLAPIVLVDVSLPAHHDARIGIRAWVRFNQGNAPLAAQLLRWGRLVMLQRFNAAD